MMCHTEIPRVGVGVLIYVYNVWACGHSQSSLFLTGRVWGWDGDVKSHEDRVECEKETEDRVRVCGQLCVLLSLGMEDPWKN